MICYIDVGTSENFRPDYRSFPASVKGRSNGWPGERWLYVRRLDVRDGAAVSALVDGLGELDVVVNCAGVIRRGAEHDPVAFAETVDVNLTGTMRVCAAARAGLKARRGCIVNTASMLSFFGGGLVPGYSASKGGVAQLTKSLAIAYALTYHVTTFIPITLLGLWSLSRLHLRLGELSTATRGSSA